MSSGLGRPLLAVSGSVAAVETLSAGDQRLDCDQVVQHRSVGDPLVAALDGLDDAPMVRVRARGPARRVERFLSTPGVVAGSRAGPVQWIPGGALEDGRLAAYQVESYVTWCGHAQEVIPGPR